MAKRQVEFASGEWYHCYSRTIDRSRPFEDPANVERFLETLYLANGEKPMPIISFLHRTHSHEDIFSLPRRNSLVSIGCYCIMPTHYHFLLQPIVDDGITHFMRSVGIAFTKFYNEQNDRIGNLFVKPFRSKHIDDDHYLDRVVQYIHLNSIELFEPQWKNGIIHNPHSIAEQLRSYEYSSLWEHEGRERAQSPIVDLETLGHVRENKTDIIKMIAEAAEYYQFLELDL